MSKPKPDSFDKYYYYSKAVQSPAEDVRFFYECFRDHFGRVPGMLAEDFCGAFAISCAWVKHARGNQAIGYDLDPDPIRYGKENNFTQLSPDEQSRIAVFEKNVLDHDLVNSDLICATNFSYFTFRERARLKEYFLNCHRRLNSPGMLVLDIFGGSHCYGPIEEETEYESEGFSYFWDLDAFNPITNEAHYYIHFQLKNQERHNKVFSYHWRMWSIPEVRDILAEAGFEQTVVFWEGTAEDGHSGNSEFTPTEVGEACDGWIAYIMAFKKLKP